MTLSNYQFAFTPSGAGATTFTFGAGTPYTIELVEGLMDTAGIRNQDENRGYIDGSYSGRDFYDARMVTFHFIIIGDGSYNAQYYYQQLQKNLAPQVTGYYPDPYATTQASTVLGLLQFQLTDATGNQRIWGRVRSVKAQVDPDFAYGYIGATVEMYFPDPRYYDETATVVSGTSVSLTNSGWATATPAITIASPYSSGTLTDSSGNSMIFANVNTSYPLVIDLLQRNITQNGASARNTLTSMTNWLYLPANTTTSWNSTLGSMSVTYRNAYV
jgi:hypothetical protein